MNSPPPLIIRVLFVWFLPQDTLWDLRCWPGVELGPLAVKAQSSIHCLPTLKWINCVFLQWSVRQSNGNEENSYN